MQQQIKAEVVVNIPSDYVLVKKAEFEQLQDEKLIGRYWTMKDLEERTGMKQAWLKEHLLYVPKLKRQLEKFIYYPSQGEKWAFQATKMAEFLEDNFYLIFKTR